jgi:hypothetical protein
VVLLTIPVLALVKNVAADDLQRTWPSGYLPYVGPASTQYGPGSQALLYRRVLNGNGVAASA